MVELKLAEEIPRPRELGAYIEYLNRFNIPSATAQFQGSRIQVSIQVEDLSELFFIMKTAILASLFSSTAFASTIYLAGDSTMADNGGGSGTYGTYSIYTTREST